MAVINVLDKQTAELIAAGEVVERPASVVKELVENSIDAGAGKILVNIERGGIKKIIVQDNGSGIDGEYVKTAFIRHATSKIKHNDDLRHISSLGFRGEALASIASVSHVELITKTEIQDFAVEIQLSAGSETSFEFKPFVTGSRFIIKDLFYNTPARMKFLKKDATEAGYIQDILTNLALSRPDIAFTFIKDGKEVFSTFGDGNLINTVAALFGTDYAQTLLPVEYADDKYQITGLTTSPHSSRQSRNMQFSFINSRFVKNKTVISAVEQAYKGTVMVGKFPGYILNVSMPFDCVDVNVHPAKTEVRFSNDSEVFSAVYRSIKLCVCGQEKLKQFEFPKTEINRTDNAVKQQSFTCEEKPLKPTNDIEYLNFTLKDNLNSNAKTDDYIKKYITSQMETDEVKNDYLESCSFTEYKLSSYDDAKKSEVEEIPAIKNSVEEGNLLHDNSFFEIPEEEIKVIGQIFDTYILCQIGDEMVIIDKHAAHERMLYEQLKENAKSEKQILLVPSTVKLSAEEKNAILENIDLLDERGFEVEDFGGGVIVRAIPMYITKEDPQSLISEIAYNLSNGQKARMSEKIDWIFHSVACRSAIKAGDKAEITRLTRLVRDIRQNRIPLYCPHGRPVIITISKKEIEKQFGR